MKAKVDAQGRLVIPQAQRRRLGIDGPWEVEMIPTAEGVAIEPTRAVRITTAGDGLSVATIDGAGTIRNVTVLGAIHAERAER
ncbi:hypothetical protein BH23ACT12_BH23ACT12_14790 [soil metagenome]